MESYVAAVGTEGLELGAVCGGVYTHRRRVAGVHAGEARASIRVGDLHQAVEAEEVFGQERGQLLVAAAGRRDEESADRGSCAGEGLARAVEDADMQRPGWPLEREDDDAVIGREKLCRGPASVGIVTDDAHLGTAVGREIGRAHV